MNPRFTQERLLHILKRHPEMEPHLPKIDETVAQSDVVTPSKSDATVSLYYRKYDLAGLGTKYLRVAVKHTEGDSFILTAHFTNKIQEGGMP